MRVLRSVLPVLAGVVLGVATRLDEAEPAVSAGLSSSAAWLATAAALGATRGGAGGAAPAGAAGLTVANLAYYLTDGFYGPVATWLAVGVAGGAVAGAAGGWARRGAARATTIAAGVAGIAALEALDVHVSVLGLHLP